MEGPCFWLFLYFLARPQLAPLWVTHPFVNLSLAAYLLPGLQLGISYLASAKGFQEMVLWKHIFKMKTDKAVGSRAKENSTLSEKQAVSWPWKPTCSKAPPHPLLKALAHRDTWTHRCSATGLQNRP